jgi:hypothetical protein
VDTRTFDRAVVGKLPGRVSAAKENSPIDPFAFNNSRAGGERDAMNANRAATPHEYSPLAAIYHQPDKICIFRVQRAARCWVMIAGSRAKGNVRSCELSDFHIYFITRGSTIFVYS